MFLDSSKCVWYYWNPDTCQTKRDNLVQNKTKILTSYHGQFCYNFHFNWCTVWKCENNLPKMSCILQISVEIWRKIIVFNYGHNHHVISFVFLWTLYLFQVTYTYNYIPWNLPLLTREPEEQAEIWVHFRVITNAAPGSLSINLLAWLFCL